MRKCPTSDFPVYVSSGSKEKLECYKKNKSIGTVIIFKITCGLGIGKVLILQITNNGARSISLPGTNVTKNLTRALIYARNK